jgi:hypothetical protein
MAVKSPAVPAHPLERIGQGVLRVVPRGPRVQRFSFVSLPCVLRHVVDCELWSVSWILSWTPSWTLFGLLCLFVCGPCRLVRVGMSACCAHRCNPLTHSLPGHQGSPRNTGWHPENCQGKPSIHPSKAAALSKAEICEGCPCGMAKSAREGEACHWNHATVPVRACNMPPCLCHPAFTLRCASSMSPGQSVLPDAAAAATCRSSKPLAGGLVLAAWARCPCEGCPRAWPESARAAALVSRRCLVSNARACP